jgi:hypothetical protein
LQHLEVPREIGGIGHKVRSEDVSDDDVHEKARDGLARVFIARTLSLSCTCLDFFSARHVG